MGNNEENWVTPPSGLSCGSKYHPQLKTKKNWGGGDQLWKVIRKNTVNKDKVVMQIQVSALCIDKNF